MCDVAAVDPDAAAGRLDQPQDRAADRGFSAAGFADQAKRLAGLNREADAIDREHGAAGALQQALANGEMLLEVAHLEHGRTRTIGGARFSHRGHRTAQWNASTPPSGAG